MVRERDQEFAAEQIEARVEELMAHYAAWKTYLERERKYPRLSPGDEVTLRNFFGSPEEIEARVILSATSCGVKEVVRDMAEESLKDEERCGMLGISPGAKGKVITSWAIGPYVTIEFPTNQDKPITQDFPVTSLFDPAELQSQKLR
ncbi:hypothetical protein FJZ40_03590 [Candidatus Shapirobacteria bacterium]|nr:hypothetical protein [Candidatus Shapirobacteria bacterium]